ncbi:MAG TPA: acyl-CoA dehydrogenase family protein [Blastocatellia bacterium]|jgi:alkylation response protein AidB-like acyl-CoA dehydrogenase|nr:acyl-CoA dehydrogenase family protein [Blastocatellia bacterium]
MDFDLNETQKLFKRSARDLFAAECPPNLVREMIEKGEPYSETLWNKLVEQGWTGLIFSEEDEGMGLGLVEMTVAFEEMGYALVPGEFLSTVALAGPVLARGSGEQKDKYLKAICEGRARATVALLEEKASWEIDSVTLEAVETPEGYRLSGKKLFVTDAEVADCIITAARIGPDLALLLVDRDTPGVSIARMPGLDLSRGLSEVTFADAEVPSSNLIARGAPARLALQEALDIATIAVTAEMVGGMQWALENAVEYAKTRKQFGKPIGQFQAIQHHCANMLLMTESARSAVYYAAWIMGNDPEQAPVAVSLAKTYASDSYREVGNLCIQVLGGLGFTWEENIHFYYKRAKASELLFGDATFHRERIAASLMNRMGEPEKAASQAGD